MEGRIPELAAPSTDQSLLAFNVLADKLISVGESLKGQSFLEKMIGIWNMQLPRNRTLGRERVIARGSTKNTVTRFATHSHSTDREASDRIPLRDDFSRLHL